MSRKKKIFIILHLCFAFAFLFWLLIQPYAKQVVAQKSEIALYEMVMERDELFEELPLETQELLFAGYEKAQEKQAPSFFHQFGHLFFVQTPAFALAWLFFSIVICFLLLFRIEGAALAVWILPITVVGYAYSLYSSANTPNNSLFPTEEYVLRNYVESLELKSLNQRESLLLGWHRYLVKEWSSQEPSLDEEMFSEQLDAGLFAFNVARLAVIASGEDDEVVTAGFTTPPSILRVMGYFMWNLFLAWYINRKEKRLSSAAVSNPSY